ncbi:reverse transcriptase domain-containing protein [Variovorax boronicumulans]|uniref:reverse transcriptase domain-containing protein n=1 Tax=Variovorax boronicumulans TaxID=436515 RepID=UPI0036F36873
MSSSTLGDIARFSALKAAWNKVSRGKLGKLSAERVGGDGHSLASFQRRLDDELAVLERRLSQGTFQFSPLDPYFIPKQDGKYRVICVPTVADRVVQRAVLDSITARQRWMVNPVSFGFVAEGGVERAADAAVKLRRLRPWVFKTDITKFFDQVDRQLLSERVARLVRQKSVHPLLLAAISCEIKPRRSSHVERIKKMGIIEGRGVRQGMPLSPFFANLFLADFDRACVKKGLHVLRYADDLLCLATTESEAKGYEEFCIAELSKLNLAIPKLADATKTHIYSPSAPAEFLGVELAPITNGRYEVRIGQKQLDAIKDRFYTLSSLDELKRRNLDITRLGNSLASRRAAYGAAYEFCANQDHLISCVTDWSKAVLRKVAQQLGIKVDSLSAEGRWFLGLE